MPKKNKPEENLNAERWLVSYADFVTLLFILFIILYSFSQIDVKKYQQVAASLAYEFSGGRQGMSGGGNPVMKMPGTGPGDGTGLEELLSPEEKEKKALEKVADEIAKYAREKGVSANINLHYDEERGLYISITGTVLYEDASATLTREAKEFVKIISDQLKKLPNHIRIEGHTDNRPINSAEFPSNWELSAARSVNLVRYLIEELDFDPTRLSVAGYSEYRPVASNDTVEGQNKNRRVEIIVLKTEEREP
ncbi:MAG TPA: OmpA family protein [Clostridia bacterium]|jgi:chemotaxis protein MotB|nr:OmpA family protein [Clostridia bacterium]